MDSLEQNLNRHLYRHDCPDPLLLGEYHLGLLDPGDRSLLQDHLSLCPHCRREVAQLAGFLQATREAPAGVVEPTLLEKVRIYLVDLFAPDEALDELAPAWRESENKLGDQTQFRVRRVGEYLVSITIQPRPDAPGRSIVGDVANMENPSTTFEEWVLHFWQHGRLRQVMPISDTGSFVLESDESGPFELILTGPDLEIHLQHPGYG